MSKNKVKIVKSKTLKNLKGCFNLKAYLTNTKLTALPETWA